MEGSSVMRIRCMASAFRSLFATEWPWLAVDRRIRPMQLHQINVGYDSFQDRLLLRFSTTEQVEYRMWITRHMLKGMWPGLVQLLTNTPMARQQAQPEAKRAVVEFQREQALAATTFGKQYDGETLRPGLSDEPMLIWGLRMRPAPEGGHDIEFLPRQGPGVHLRLQDAMVHALTKLLQDAVKVTEWDLRLELPVAAPSAVGPVAAEHKLN
jgi:hypothetical protein